MKEILTPDERQSPAWQKMRGYIEDRINKVQVQINTPGIPHDQTEGLRYLLKELTAMLGIEREPLKIKPASAEGVRRFPGSAT